MCAVVHWLHFKCFWSLEAIIESVDCEKSSECEWECKSRMETCLKNSLESNIIHWYVLVSAFTLFLSISSFNCKEMKILFFCVIMGHSDRIKSSSIGNQFQLVFEKMEKYIREWQSLRLFNTKLNSIIFTHHIMFIFNGHCLLSIVPCSLSHV